MKSRVGRLFGKVLFAGAASDASRFGLNREDWFAVWNSPFISITDILKTRGRPYHLVQKIPMSVLRSKDNPYLDLLQQ